MTQDQWGQPRNPGYVIPGEVVPNDESGVTQAGQAPPMTQFQKVAPRADQPGQAGQSASQDPDDTPAEEDRAVSSPDAGNGDDWEADEDALEDEPAEEPAAGPAWGAAASVSAPPTDPGAGPEAPARQAEEPAGQAEEPAGHVQEPADEARSDGQAEEPAEQVQEPADEARPDGHQATGASMTQPLVSVAAPRPPAATVPTVPIPVAAEPADDGEPPAAAAEAQLRPGESGTTLGLGESGYANLIADTADLRAQWHGIQYNFVDDPRASVTEAADVIAQVATRLEAAIAERQRGLRGRWDTSGTVDTETLRETLRMYRAFLDQLIGPEPN